MNSKVFNLAVVKSLDLQLNSIFECGITSAYFKH